MEMENSGVQCQKSISSVSTSNPIDSHGTSGSTSNTPEFVNPGMSHEITSISLSSMNLSFSHSLKLSLMLYVYFALVILCCLSHLLHSNLFSIAR